MVSAEINDTSYDSLADFHRDKAKKMLKNKNKRKLYIGGAEKLHFLVFHEKYTFLFHPNEN